MRAQYRNTLLLSAAVALSAAFAVPGPAQAALGGDADSVIADSTALRAQLRSTPMVQYNVQQISSDGLLVHEYVTLSGQVFAVTWQGPTPPDLRQLLGSYFARFQSAAASAHQANPGVHRRFTIAQSDLVVQAGGRLRDFRGIAYLPSLVPSGVSISQLQ